jgi:hypothetical protein
MQGMGSPSRQNLEKRDSRKSGGNTVVIPTMADAAGPSGRRDSAEDLERAVLLERRGTKSMTGGLVAPGQQVRLAGGRDARAQG